MSNSFYAGPSDLSDRHAALDAVDALRLKDDSLATWARGVVDPTERDLGQLADWAADVCDYPIEGDDLPPNGDTSLHPTGGDRSARELGGPPAGLHARHRGPNRAAADERRARSILYPSARSGLVAVSPLRPPVKPA